MSLPWIGGACLSLFCVSKYASTTRNNKLPKSAMRATAVQKAYFLLADCIKNVPQLKRAEDKKKTGMTDMLNDTGTAGAMTDNDPLQESALHLLHRAGQCAGDVFQAEMAQGDLTPRQFAVLVAVSQDEGLSQTSLVRKTGIDRSTLADIVRRMLRKGLLQRQRTKDDARAYSVKLTDEGWKALRSAQPTVAVVDSRVLSVLPESSRGRFIQDLTKIVTALSQQQPSSTSQS